MSSTSRSVAVTLAGSLVPPLCALATYPILAHALGPEGRGFAAAAVAPLFLIASAMTLGLPEAFTHFGARGDLQRGRALWTAFGSLVVAGAACTVGAVVLAPLLSAGDPGLSRAMILISCLSVPALLVFGFRGLALARHRWKLVASERTIGGLLRLALVLLFVTSFGLTPTVAAVILGATLFAGGAVYLRLIKKDSVKVSVGPRPVGISARELHAYGARAWLGAVAGVLLMRLDQLLITPLAGLEQLGLYVVAVNVAEIALVFNASVREVIFTKQSAYVDDEALSRAARISTAFTAAIVALLCVAAPVGIPALFGVEFSGAVWPTVILLIAILVGNPGSVVGAGLGANGRPELRSYSLVAALALNVLLVVLLVPIYGAVGAAIATAFGNLVSGGLNVIFYSRLRNVGIMQFVGVRAEDLRQGSRMASDLFRRPKR